jgi:DNA-binding SARP family transcriptional activator
VLVGDEFLPPPATLKARSLLAYLIVHRDRACPREQLADLFWPERPRDKALRSLSTALWHVRRVLPPGDYILADAQTLRFNSASDYWLDVEAFQVSTSPKLEPETLGHEAERLQRAVDLYQGDFLEGFYEDWCLEERYRLEGLYLAALERLAAVHEALDQPQEALRYAGLLLTRDPLRENVHCTAIRLQVRLGNRAEAVRQAWWCRTVLRTELGVEPGPETVALCDELLGPAWRREPGQEALTQHGSLPRSQPSLILERPPFVGREAEWETLLAHWERARSGQGHLMLVSGEAGIGKSRLVEELSQYVQQRGGWAACGCCYEYERALPPGPLADLLHAVLAVTGARVLERLPPWQVAELARLAPELDKQLPSPPQRFLPANQEQTRLFDALTLFLLDLARQNPLLLVLEDLHWAYDSTLAWLHYLARHLPEAPTLLLATYRNEEVGPAHPLHGLELQLERERLAEQLELTRLPREALARWMAGASDSLVARIHRQTEGNPFFALETLRALFEEGRVRLVGGRWVEEAAPSSPSTGSGHGLPIPASVRQVVRWRLERLSPSPRKAASMAAVIGRAFDFDVLEQAWGEGEEATLEALDELLRRRLIREGSGPTSRDYEFDHHLVQEVIYQGLHHRRRRRLHRLVGEAMERLYAGQYSVAGELAHHFERAHETEKALAWLVEAGEQARQKYAHQEALGYFRRALTLLAPEQADALAARTLTGLAIAHRDVVGEEEPVWRWLERALSIWEVLGDGSTELEARAGVAEARYALAYQYADFDQARAQVERGLQAAQSVDGLEQMVARGYGQLARFYEHEGRFAQAREWAQRQLELSQRIGNRRELAHAHHRLGSLLLRVGGPMSEAVAHEKEAARLAEDLGWLDFAAGSHNIAGYCLLALGRTAEAEKECRLALHLSTELDIPWRQCWAYHYLAAITSLRGQVAEASAWLDQAEATMVHQPTHFQEIVLLGRPRRSPTSIGDGAGDEPALLPPLHPRLGIGTGCPQPGRGR